MVTGVQTCALPIYPPPPHRQFRPVRQQGFREASVRVVRDAEVAAAEEGPDAREAEEHFGEGEVGARAEVEGADRVERVATVGEDLEVDFEVAQGGVELRGISKQLGAKREEEGRTPKILGFRPASPGKE